jgi:hypothetical protein
MRNARKPALRIRRLGHCQEWAPHNRNDYSFVSRSFYAARMSSMRNATLNKFGTLQAPATKQIVNFHATVYHHQGLLGMTKTSPILHRPFPSLLR